MTSVRCARAALVALYAGLGLTVIWIGVVLAQRTLLADHVRSGYPGFIPERVEEAVSLWVILLSVVAGLGVLGWLVSIWSVHAGKAWGRWLAPALFVTGTSIAAFLLLVRDTSGDTGLPTLVSGIGMLPSIAGLAAVVLLWRPVGAVQRSVV